MTTSQWDILPHFLLRSTGFPFAWLERLAFTETAEMAEAVLDCEEEIEALVTKALAALRADTDGETVKLRRRAWDRINRRRPTQVAEESLALLPQALSTLLVCWDATLQKHATLLERARGTFAQEMRSRRHVLRELVSETQFQEAVWLSSPQMFQHGLKSYLEHWNPDERSSKTRHVERQLISYLQRFCAKNDTASFFGPLNYGDFTNDYACELAGPGAEHVSRREVFMAYWGVLALADLLEADLSIQPYLRPRWSPLCALDLTARRVGLPGGHTLSLSAQEARMLALIDEQRTIQEIASESDVTANIVLEGLQRLRRAHLIMLRPDPPVTEVRPLEWLLDWVERIPQCCSSRSHWVAVIGEFKHLQDRFTQAPFSERRELLAQVETRMTELTGQQARRGEGQIYADRLLLYEECLGGVSPLALGPTFAAELQRQLAPILDVYAAHACAVHAQLCAYGEKLLQECAPHGELPFLDLVGHLRAKKEEAFAAQTTPVQEAFLTMLSEQADQPAVEIDPQALPSLDRSEFLKHVLLTSPDVMVLARNEEALRAGDFRIVMAECHDTLMVWGWAISFHAQRVRVQREASAFLARVYGARTMANVLASKRVKIVPFEYPGPTIEVQATSVKAATERIPIAQVTITQENGVPKLQAPGWPSLSLYNGELPTLAHSLFAPPRVVPPSITLGAHTPRLTLNQAVLQREQWCVRREELLPDTYQGISFELMLDMQRAARRLNLPRYLFARIQGERKPVLVDRHNYFLLELLAYLLPKEGEVTLSEALPGPDDLWLRGEKGAYCAELRLSVGYVSQEGTSL